MKTGDQATNLPTNARKHIIALFDNIVGI